MNLSSPRLDLQYLEAAISHMKAACMEHKHRHIDRSPLCSWLTSLVFLNQGMTSAPLQENMSMSFEPMIPFRKKAASKGTATMLLLDTWFVLPLLVSCCRELLSFATRRRRRQNLNIWIRKLSSPAARDISRNGISAGSNAQNKRKIQCSSAHPVLMHYRFR